MDVAAFAWRLLGSGHPHCPLACSPCPCPAHLQGDQGRSPRSTGMGRGHPSRSVGSPPGLSDFRSCPDLPHSAAARTPRGVVRRAHGASLARPRCQPRSRAPRRLKPLTLLPGPLCEMFSLPEILCNVCSPAPRADDFPPMKPSSRGPFREPPGPCPQALDSGSPRGHSLPQPDVTGSLSVACSPHPIENVWGGNAGRTPFCSQGHHDVFH